MRHSITRWLPAILAIAILTLPVSAAQHDRRGLRLADVAVSIDDAAFVDWNRESTAVFEIERDIIRDIFRSAALDGAQPVMTGKRAVILAINVTYFDILSDLEKFFCCARNEVNAEYQLLDAATGEALAAADELDFDHVGRGGFLLLLNRDENDTQLSRLYNLIAEGTRDWLSPPR